MHLNNFADPKPYTVSVDDVSDFLDQLERVWSKNDVAFLLGIKRPKPMDASSPQSRQRRSSALCLQPRM